MMTEYADLEVGLHRRSPGSYAVEFRYNQPHSETDVRLNQNQSTQAAIDIEALNQLILEPDAYSRKLTESLFGEPGVKAAFAQVRTSAETLDLPLRMRLMIGPSAPELHRVHWEALLDPHDSRPLATSENLLFSRYLSSSDWRPVRLRAKGELRGLALVANPSDLNEYDLAPVDVESEIERAKKGLVEIPITTLPDADNTRRASLPNLISALRSNEHDILYLACHGTLVKDEPWLWLEDEAGKAARTSGRKLVTQLRELEQRPRLVVLASCESAGAGTGDALASLGPRLAEAGIPAVLAMQGKISMQTVADFMPVFFNELQHDGQIDRALAVARAAVRQRPDYWMPALFMRLKSGRLWYVPGFGDVDDEFATWASLTGFIKEKVCTPIIGPGLVESMLGPRREIAIRWAEKHGFPLDPHDRDVMPSVAQYILTHQSPAYLPVALREALRDEILERYQTELPDDIQKAPTWSQAILNQALEVVADSYLAHEPDDPYRRLAELRLPIYINAGTLDLMSRALVEVGAEPVVRICPWNKWIPQEMAIYEDTPTPEKPLVYHLFGNLNLPNSLVYAEDRYFDYLIGVTLNKSLIPSAVRAALSNTSLLFLGFQMDDWEFRVFFRYLMAQDGHELLKFYSHAAAQIEPEEDRIVDVKRARKYLEKYFESESIEIYWGSTKEFIKELCRHI
jgi:hypothetical protein